MKNQVHEDNVHCVKWSIEILPDSQRLDLFRILCNTKGGQTIVLNIFVIKVLDQLCSLVNWSFEIIYFATDWDIISFMSFIQSSLSLQCSHRLSCVSRGFCHAPLSLLPTKQNNSHLQCSHCPLVGFHFYLYTDYLQKNLLESYCSSDLLEMSPGMEGSWAD